MYVCISWTKTVDAHTLTISEKCISTKRHTLISWWTLSKDIVRVWIHLKCADEVNLNSSTRSVSQHSDFHAVLQDPLGDRSSSKYKISSHVIIVSLCTASVQSSSRRNESNLHWAHRQIKDPNNSTWSHRDESWSVVPKQMVTMDFTEESETVLLLRSMLNYGRSRKRMYLGHEESFDFETAQLADDSLVSTRAAVEYTLNSVKGTVRLVNEDTPRSMRRATFFSGPLVTSMVMAVIVWEDACVMAILTVVVAKYSCRLAFNFVSELITSPRRWLFSVIESAGELRLRGWSDGLHFRVYGKALHMLKEVFLGLTWEELLLDEILWGHVSGSWWVYVGA